MKKEIKKIDKKIGCTITQGKAWNMDVKVFAVSTEYGPFVSIDTDIGEIHIKFNHICKLIDNLQKARYYLIDKLAGTGSK